jgi:hypothetical protein
MSPRHCPASSIERHIFGQKQLVHLISTLNTSLPAFLTDHEAINIMTDHSISSFVTQLFIAARLKYHAENRAWIDLSGRLAGRSSLHIAAMSLQRQGDLDLVLRGMEDEAIARKSQQAAQVMDPTPHYQMMFSESWIIGCYEILRAIRQRDGEQRDEERKLRPDAVSALPSFQSIFADLERLRMPIAKYEIAKEGKKPLAMRAIPPNGDATDDRVYDKRDPARSHIMPSGLSSRGSVTWLALDHLTPREYWVERRDLSDRLLGLLNEVVPAGILEAQRAAAASKPDDT